MFENSILITVIAISFFIIARERFLYRKKFLMHEKQINHLKKNVASYQKLSERYEEVVSNIREVLFQLDSQGKLLYANHSWEKLSGFGLEESLGKKLPEFIPVSETIGLSSNVQTKMLKAELNFVSKNGEPKIIEIVMLPLFSSEGRVKGYSGSINDVTERKEQEMFIKESKQYVEELNLELEKRVHEEVYMNRQKDHILIEQSRLASMGEMLASIGHQWRQPLNSLSLLIQDVSEALEFEEIDEHYMARFTKESMVLINHMSQTINDFRKFYLPNREKAVFSLSESIEDALSIFSISLKKYNIQVKFEYRGQQKAYGFQNEFSQAVLNVLTNARDAFIENNVRNPVIQIKIAENKMFYLTEITDNAGGITPGLMEKIFDPYFSTRPNGSGLGLYMSKMILDHMDGMIKVKNSGEGVQFQLFIPKVPTVDTLESSA